MAAIEDLTDVSMEPAPLSWFRQDPEQKLLFRGGRFTRVNTKLSLLLGVAVSVLFFMALAPFRDSWLFATFYQRGLIPYAIVVLFNWSLMILLIKWRKLRLQQRALQYSVVPEHREFVLSPVTVDEVVARMYRIADEPRQFTLLNRIEIALSNLRNLGRVADVDEILRSQGEHDESTMETSYSLVNAFVWAIPVLGFIGTVLGLSQAIGGFGEVLATTEDLSQIKTELQTVTGGLSVAFETTLQGLVCALFIQLLLTTLKKQEEEFLDDCSEYCVRHIVGRLRLTPYQGETS